MKKSFCIRHILTLAVLGVLATVSLVSGANAGIKIEGQRTIDMSSQPGGRFREIEITVDIPSSRQISASNSTVNVYCGWPVGTFGTGVYLEAGQSISMIEDLDRVYPTGNVVKINCN